MSIAPDCRNVEAYTSAFSCIYAASDATKTATSQQPDTTVLVTVLEGATTTITSTVRSNSTATTTTSACTPSSTRTGEIFVVGGLHDGQALAAASSGLAVVTTPGTGAQVIVTRAGGQPYLADNPALKMWISFQSSVGRLNFSQVSNPGTTWVAVVCSVRDATNKLSCRAGNLDVDTFYTIPTNGQVYMAGAAYLSTRTAPFTVIDLTDSKKTSC